MSLAELVNSRREIFQRPKTRRDIIKGRKIVYVNKFEEIVPTMEQRKEDEAVVISPKVNIIPLDSSGIPQYYSAQNFSKRGPLVILRTFSAQEQIQKQWSDLKARIDAESRYKNEKFNYVGWKWTGTDGKPHVIQPWTVLEGRRLEMYCHKSDNIADKIIFKKPYHAKKSHIFGVLMNVPSRSSEKFYFVLMENLTRLKDVRKYAEWTRFTTDHRCGFKSGDFGFRFRDLVTYCPHDVAAHVAYSRIVANKSGIIPPQPFPMFTEPMLRLYLSLAYDTMKMDRIKEPNGQERIKSRPLSVFEINPLLIDAWLRYGNKATFFVRSMTKQYKTGPPVGQRKRMADYNWSISAPGMPFERYE